VRDFQPEAATTALWVNFAFSSTPIPATKMAWFFIFSDIT